MKQIGYRKPLLPPIWLKKAKAWGKVYIGINLVLLLIKPEIPFAQYDFACNTVKNTVLNLKYFGIKRKYGSTVAEWARVKDQYCGYGRGISAGWDKFIELIK